MCSAATAPVPNQQSSNAARAVPCTGRAAVGAANRPHSTASTATDAELAAGLDPDRRAALAEGLRALGARHVPH